MDKSPDAFRTISEVAADLGLPQHVLRFWETRFSQIKPLKRGGGRRYYRPDDVELLKGIRHLLYGEGYTIRGVQRILKEQGVRFVMNVWREGAPQPAPAAVQTHEAEDDEAMIEAEAMEPDDADDGDEAGDHGGVEPGVGAEARAGRHGVHAGGEAGPSAASIAQRFAPRSAPPRGEAGPAQAGGARPANFPIARAPGGGPAAYAAGVGAARAAQGGPHGEEGHRSALGSLIDRLRPGRDSADTAHDPRPGSAGLSREDVRRLQTTLFELLECKRLLDQAR